MDLLQNLLDSTQYAALTAFILGLMTAISPCPLATNITAIGFIGRNLENRNRVFLSGLVYTLGRAISYTALGLILFFGASKMHVSLLFQSWGEKLLGPVLILIGIFMLDIIRFSIPGISGITERIGNKQKLSYWSSLLLGMAFAMAFCPYSGVLFFVMLIPMTIASPEGLYLPLIYAVATGLPVIIFAWLLAYAMGNVGKYYNKLKSFEKVFRRIVAILFILAGIYFIVLFFF